MMEPKFRVWSKTLGKYRQLDETSNDQGLGMLFEVEKGIGGNVISICYSIGDVVEQSTGLKDANGNMIYENDIIKYFGANKRVKIKTTYGIVFYDSEHGCFNSRIQNEEHNKGGISPLDDLIVGNVHENPELLEEDK